MGKTVIEEKYRDRAHNNNKRVTLLLRIMFLTI